MRIAIFYATREGQTERVVQRIAADLLASGVDVDVVDLRATNGRHVDMAGYSSACVASPVHVHPL